jgi:molecular chaperone DnaJ
VNLFCEVPVNFTTLALGGEISLPTLDGTERVKVSGTATGDAARARQGPADERTRTR